MKSFRAILFSIFMCLTIFQSAVAGDWRVVGNGGGGIVTKDGTPAIYEKYKKLAWVKLENDQFTSLVSVIEVVRNLKIPTGPKQQLLLALESRTYYLVPKEEAKSQNFVEAKQIYAGLFNRLSTDISVLALTIVESNETLFMPEFFRLTLNEQQSIFLHEALWTIKPDLEYAKMISIESAFYNYLESLGHGSASLAEQRLYSALAKHIFGSAFLVQSILMTAKKKSLKEILGPELTHCAYHTTYGCSYANGGHTPLAKALKDNQYLRISINAFHRSIPKSPLAKFDLRQNLNFRSWNKVATRPYVKIPFFHRTHTCVKLSADSKLNADLYLVIFDSSADMEYFPSVICGDLNQ